MADERDGTTGTTGERLSGAAREAADALRDAGRDATERAKTAFGDHVADPARRAGEALKESGQTIAEGGATIGRAMIDQAEQNAREAFAAMRRAAEAKDVGEVMRIQGDYLRDQGQRSMAQAREIGELIMRFGRDAVAPLRGGQG